MLKKIKLSNSVLVFLAMILGSIAGLLIGPGGSLHRIYRNHLAEYDENVPGSCCYFCYGEWDHKHG